jgi:hypothetical protein
MVERPIKKSERVQKEQAVGQESTEGRGNQGRDKRGDRDDRRNNNRERKGGRGRGKGDRTEKKPPVPLALMRGPKPNSKPITPEPEVEEAVEEAAPEVNEDAANQESTPEETGEAEATEAVS